MGAYAGGAHVHVCAEGPMCPQVPVGAGQLCAGPAPERQLCASWSWGPMLQVRALPPWLPVSVLQQPLAGAHREPSWAVWAEGIFWGQRLEGLMGVAGVPSCSRGRCLTIPKPGALLGGLPLGQLGQRLLTASWGHVWGLAKTPSLGNDLPVCTGHKQICPRL